MVAATVFLGVCGMVMLISDIALEGLDLLPRVHIKSLDWLAAIRTLIALTLAFYLSRRTLVVFDLLIDKRKVQSSDYQNLN